MKLVLSQRKRLPVLVLENSKVAFPMWSYTYLSKVEKANMFFNDTACHALLEIMHGGYKPPFSLRNKTVLDLGACCGETAWYFLKILGAAKVYCVECDTKHISILEHNKNTSKLNYEIIPEPFNLDHLKLPHDFIKCDIEGSEDLLLEYILSGGNLKPCALEIHGAERKVKFIKNGFEVSAKLSPECFLANNFTQFL